MNEKKVRLIRVVASSISLPVARGVNPKPWHD